MTEAALNDGQLDPGLQQPRGIAMAQCMDAAGLLDAAFFLARWYMCAGPCRLKGRPEMWLGNSQ